LPALCGPIQPVSCERAAHQENSVERSENNDMQLVDMKWIAATLKVTDKWIYKQIQDGEFMKPIKLGRSSRWRLSDIHEWLENRVK